MSDSDILFASGPLSVTSNMLRFRGRRYKLVHIENLILKRPLFLIGLGLAALLAGFGLVNDDLLYLHEMLLIAILAILAPLAAWPLGTLQIQSRTLSIGGGSITWLHRDLAQAQSVIEDTMVTSATMFLPHKD